MPICPVCGNPMKLEDMREKLEKTLGLIYPEDDDAGYVIKCCGYRLLMENKEERREAVRLLKSYHQSHK
jgi:hypothetical protein